MTQSPSVGWWNGVLNLAYLISNFSQVGYAVQNKKAPTEVEACSVETEITADAAVLPADTWCRDGVAVAAVLAHRACLASPFVAAYALVAD